MTVGSEHRQNGTRKRGRKSRATSPADDRYPECEEALLILR